MAATPARGAAPRQRSPLRLISRRRAAAGGVALDVPVADPGAPLPHRAAARQPPPHDRSGPRHLAQHPAQPREPSDTPTDVGYAVAEVVQRVDGSGGAGLNALSRAADQVTATKGQGQTQRPAQCAGRRSPSWEERRPRTERGARAVSGGSGQGEGVDRPPASRWEQTRGTRLGATAASMRRRSWRARLTPRLRTSVRAATPRKRIEGLTRRGLPAWP
jgi:hypothetical protein